MTSPDPSSSDAVSALQGTLQRLGQHYKYARQIAESTDAVIKNGKLPSNLSEQSKTDFLNALSNLQKGAETIRKLGEQIEVAVPKVQSSISEQKQQIENDFQKFSQQLAQDKNQTLEQITQSEHETDAALKELEKNYKAQKEELKNKLKQLAEAKKVTDRTFVEKKKTAQTALSKAIYEAEVHPPAFDETLITTAQNAEIQLVTELNKAKGYLQAVFAAPQDAETLKTILG